MINDWLTPDGLRAIERMGWPEQLSYAEGEIVTRFGGWIVGVVDVVALALLRDKAREWLEKHRITVRLSVGSYLIEREHTDSSGSGIWTECYSIGDAGPYWDAEGGAEAFTDYDQADIAAVLEVGNV